MKTKFLTALVAVALGGAAYADHRPGHPDAPQARNPGNSPTVAETDDTPMAWRAVRYPFRVGYSVVRTPLIVGQTFTGKRTFYSDRGFFQMNEPSTDSDDRKTTAKGRGQRSAR